MTEYKENVWYGWNGGECPVHPETFVEYIYLDDSIGPCLCKDEAGRFIWLNNDGLPIVSFRVIKEHKEPREFWLVLNRVYTSEIEAKIYANNVDSKVIHVREVLD